MSLPYRLLARLPSVVLARRNLSRAKVRSALAAASILIGVVAIATVGAGGAAFKRSQLDDIRDQGATNVFVLPGFDKEPGYFDDEDLRAIDETVGPAGVVATKGTSMELLERGGREPVSVTYIDDPRALYEIAAGRVPDDWRRSAVVSHRFARANGVAPGDRISLLDGSAAPDGTASGVERSYRVVAVLAEDQGFGTSGVYLPIERAGNRRYDQVRVTTRSVEDAERAAAALRDRFNGRKDRLLVLELTSLVRLFRTIVNGINVFLTGLASISLLVAGVSIANTMLMAVIKRREEIGVLRAVGYTRGDIVRILLVEAAMLGAIGAGAGIAVGLAVTLVANAVFLGDPLAFARESVLYLIAAVAFGIVTSVLAGAYPAWRAARERPVETLRG